MTSKKHNRFYLNEWIRTARNTIFYAIVILTVACVFPINVAIAYNDNSNQFASIEADAAEENKKMEISENDTINMKDNSDNNIMTPVEDSEPLQIIEVNLTQVDILADLKEESDSHIAIAVELNQTELERIEEKKLEEKRALYASFCYGTNERSNIPPEMLNKIIDTMMKNHGVTDSVMIGIADSIVEAENYASMNALDIISIMTLESAYGTSYCARTRNNLVGARGSNGYINYNSIADGVSHFGQFIGDYYISQGRTTLNTIGPKYCPPNAEWANKVNGIKQQYIDILNTI